MRLREFDEKERLEKANEKLEKYKTAAGADAAAADASGNFSRGNTRFKGINRATKKQFANDAKLSQLKELEINESIDPTREKAQDMIYKYFGQIYDYGDDDGLHYLDLQGELWNQLMDKYDGEIEDIVAREPTEVLMQAAQELKGIAGDMKYELDEADLDDPSRRGFLKKAAGAAAAGAAMSAVGPEIVTLVKGFAEKAGGLNVIQALKAMLKIATPAELYNMYDYYADSGILEDAITESDMIALDRAGYNNWSEFEEHCDENGVDPDDEFKRLTGQPLKVSRVDDILGQVDNTWSLEDFFDQYPEAMNIINPPRESLLSMRQLANIDTAAKGANLPAPIVAMANAVAGLVRQIFKSNGQSLAAPQQVAQTDRDAPALPAPTRPEFDMTPDLKQKEKVPVQRKGDDEDPSLAPADPRKTIQLLVDVGALSRGVLTDKSGMITKEKAQELLNKYYDGNQDMAEGEYDSRKPFGVRYKVFAGREGRMTTREYWTSSEEKLQRAVDKIQALDNFYEIDGYSYPKQSQGVAEGSEQKPAITYKDYTLQYDYQTEDDDPEGYSTATTYYFDVLKDGGRVGEAEYFDYFGNLTIRINGKTKEFGFRHPLASQISQLVSSLPDEQKKDLSDPRFESQDLTEVFADQGSGSTDRDNADYMKRRNAAKKKGYTGRETKAGTWRVFKDGNAVAAAGPFKSADEAAAWIKKHKQGITEMDKSEPSAGRDTGPRPGPDKEAKPITAKKATKDMRDMLNRAVKDAYKKKDVKEATDSATSNLIWKAMNYLPHDRPKDMEDILVQIAHNQGPVTRATDDPKKLASLVQMVWMGGQARKQKAGQQLDELSKDTLRDYMRAQPARIKGPAGLATTNPKKAARIVDPVKGDMRRALTKFKDPAYGQQGMAESNVFTDARMNAIKADQDTFVVHGKTYQVTGDTTDERQAGLAEDSLAAMRRLAGIVTPPSAVVSNGQRQYRHMPTAVQPR